MDILNYRDAVKAINLKRVRADLAARAAYERALNDDGFYKADMAYRSATLDFAVGKCAKNKLSEAERARADALAKLGMTEADLVPAYECRLCNDTGVLNGAPCKCAVDLFIRSLKDGLSVPLRDFSSIDPTAGQLKTFGILKSYAERFPDTNKRIIVLTGGAGVGKTMLAGCVADAVIKRGYTVMAMTAFGFVNRMSRYHTTFDADRNALLNPVLDCDLLIIDDLGTEAVLRNVTLEYLYLVINERKSSGKHTLITTNLSMDELETRYGERTASRLFDKSVCYAAHISGDDMRRKGV